MPLGSCLEVIVASEQLCGPRRAYLASGSLAEREVGSEASGLAGSTGVVVDVVDRTLLG